MISLYLPMGISSIPPHSHLLALETTVQATIIPAIMTIKTAAMAAATAAKTEAGKMQMPPKMRTGRESFFIRFRPPNKFVSFAVLNRPLWQTAFSPY